MKTPEPSKENPSAPNKRSFSYPKRPASACAEVLARLLAGEVLTAGDTLSEEGTMRIYLIFARFKVLSGAERLILILSAGKRLI